MNLCSDLCEKCFRNFVEPVFNYSKENISGFFHCGPFALKCFELHVLKFSLRLKNNVDKYFTRKERHLKFS